MRRVVSDVWPAREKIKKIGGRNKRKEDGARKGG
jgi:hypothetical protein